MARLAQLLGELDALRLAARERGRRLAELDVAEARRRCRVSQLVADRPARASKNSSASSTVMSSTSAIDLPLVADLQRLAVVALALADVAGDVDVGQEVHLDLDDAVALAGLAAAALDVEAEAAGRSRAPCASGRPANSRGSA